MAAAQISACSFQAPLALAEFFNFKLEEGEEGCSGNRILLAAFLPPDTIRIMREPLETAFRGCFSDQVLSLSEVSSLLLGHEIFHGIEEGDKNIYTRSQRILTTKIWRMKFYAPIHAVSEIAATYFSKRITGLPYSPFALDILLYYNYDIMEALRLYEEVSGYSL